MASPKFMLVNMCHFPWRITEHNIETRVVLEERLPEMPLGSDAPEDCPDPASRSVPPLIRRPCPQAVPNPQSGTESPSDLRRSVVLAIRSHSAVVLRIASRASREALRAAAMSCNDASFKLASRLRGAAAEPSRLCASTGKSGSERFSNSLLISSKVPTPTRELP